MNATHLTRYGCTIGTRTHTYTQVHRLYVCDDCGGAVVHGFTATDAGETVDYVRCGACGGEELISEYRYLEQVAEGHEVARSLPAPLRAQMEGDRQCLSATEAVDALFG